MQVTLVFDRVTLSGFDTREYNINKLEDSFALEQQEDFFDVVTDYTKINDRVGINASHRRANKSLVEGGTYNVQANILTTIADGDLLIWPIMRMILDFFLHRIPSKLRLTRGFYFLLTKGKNRRISKAEILGRLVFCGFKITKVSSCQGVLYVESKKVTAPLTSKNRSSSFVIRMARIGMHEKPFFIYKFRTMHPFSDHLQDYMYEVNKLGVNGDKVQNDYRVTSWGRVMRRYWLDELPQIYNLLKRDISIVGVRAVSEAKFKLYAPELRKLRTQIKPGLVPPFYADMPETFLELQDSEKKYIQEKLKAPVVTDLRYLFKSIYNIIFRGARSK